MAWGAAFSTKALAMQVPSVLAGWRVVPESRANRSFMTEKNTVFVVCLLLYLAAGTFLVFKGNVILGDALARVENVDRVLYARDPHLAAIGFNFPPLPQLAYLPFLPLASLWAPLVTYGFIGNIFSALFMAAAVYQLHGFLTDCGVQRGPRLALAATFALHPLVAFSGADGMTEAPSVLFLLLAVRNFVSWLRWGSVSSQVYVGLALSLAFLTRYEAAFAGMGAMALTAVVTAHRHKGAGRISAGLADAAVLGAPLVFTVACWLAANWMITGSPLAEVTNSYGTAQLHIPGTQPPTARLWIQGLIGILTLEPFLPVIAVIAVVVATLKRDLTFLAIAAIYVPVLGFMYVGWSTQTILGSLRYLVASVPLATLICGAALRSPDQTLLRVVGVGSAVRRERLGQLRATARGATSALPAVALTLLLAAAMPVGAAGMWAQQGSGASALALILPLPLAHSAAEVAAHRWLNERDVARYMDSLSLPEGSVLMDDFEGFGIFISSDNKRQFVITSDRDFQAALADPASADVQYILVPQPKDIAVLEAVNRTYPGFYFTGGGIADLEKEFPQSSDGPVWRLYRVKRP
jgi:hypothetical protein